MADPKHPRKFSEEFKRQIVQLYDNGKPVSEIRAEPRAGEGKQAAQDGGRRFKNGSADIHSKVAAITANAGRCPISEQCDLLGASRSTYYRLRGAPEPGEARYCQ